MCSEVIMFARVSSVPATAQIGSSGRIALLCKLHRLHHLADEAIGQDHHRIAIAIGEFERQRGQVGHLLHRMGASTMVR